MRQTVMKLENGPVHHIQLLTKIITTIKALRDHSFDIDPLHN